MEKPLVSIVIPVYKVERFLSDCIESVIKQTYENLEIILVDDGSPDTCGSICDNYAKMDHMSRLWRMAVHSLVARS
jgi:glycosyltransferase involved in cell wall biosynthesis